MHVTVRRNCKYETLSDRWGRCGFTVLHYRTIDSITRTSPRDWQIKFTPSTMELLQLICQCPTPFIVEACATLNETWPQWNRTRGCHAVVTGKNNQPVREDMITDIIIDMGGLSPNHLGLGSNSLAKRMTETKMRGGNEANSISYVNEELAADGAGERAGGRVSERVSVLSAYHDL